MGRRKEPVCLICSEGLVNMKVGARPSELREELPQYGS